MLQQLSLARLIHIFTCFWHSNLCANLYSMQKYDVGDIFRKKETTDTRNKEKHRMQLTPMQFLCNLPGCTRFINEWRVTRTPNENTADRLTDLTAFQKASNFCHIFIYFSFLFTQPRGTGIAAFFATEHVNRHHSCTVNLHDICHQTYKQYQAAHHCQNSIRLIYFCIFIFKLLHRFWKPQEISN